MELSLVQLVKEGLRLGSSDIHVVSGLPLFYRINGDLFPMDTPLFTTEQLLKKANLPSVNLVVAQEAAMITWSAIRGGPLAMEYAAWIPDARSRSAAEGALRVPPRTMLLMRSGIRLWNGHPDIRAAKSRSTVNTMVTKLPLPI